MHVTMVNNFLYLRGGAERVLFEEAELLRGQDTEISVFSRRHPQNIPAAHEELFPPYVDPFVLPVLGKLQQAPRIIYNRQSYRLFSQFLQQVKPQLIHAHNIYGGLTSAICDAATHQGIPMVMTLHDYKLLCPAYIMIRKGQVCDRCKHGAYRHCVTGCCHKESLAGSLVYAMESYFTRWGAKYAALRYLICPSKFMMRQMLEAGYEASRVVYLPNAVDVRAYTPSFTPGDYLLYVGRLSREKGIPTLLDAVRELTMPLAIVGDGPMRAGLEAFVQQHAMTDRVTFYGHQSGEALQRLYQQAAFVVIPSEWYENAPMTILEAFAYGKAVVGARIGGIPEMIEDGETGRLVTPGQSEELRATLSTLWADRPAQGAMGRAAHQVVATRFSPQRHLEDLLSLYQRALAPAATVISDQ